MAYSTQRAVSDGTLVYLDLAIGYQSRNDIKVFINDLPAPPGSWAWVGTTDKRISFTPAIPNGVEVLIQRTTRLDRIINVFASGAKFTNVTMDMNFEQVLYLTQEAVEGSALSDIYNDVDFHGYKIKNLGLAVDPNDAITYGQLQTMSTGAYQAQLAAEAARDLAALWATKLTTTVDGTNFSAKQYALNSVASANAAAASQAAALASQTAANSSAGVAANQATIATTQAGISTTKAGEAAASAAAALVSQNAAAASAVAAADSADEAEYWVGQVAGGPVASVAGLTGIVTKAQLKTATKFVESDPASTGEIRFAGFTGAGFTRPYLWRDLAVGTDGTWLAALNSAGVNSDIKSITGLTTALSLAQGGTGATTAAGAKSNIGLANVLNARQVLDLRGTNAIYIGYLSGSLDVQVDSTYFGNTWPINITGGASSALNANYASSAGNAATLNGGANDRCNNWGFAGANYNLPYMRLDNSGNIRYLVYNTGQDTTVQGLRLYASSPYTFEISGASGSFGITANPSDERLKENIKDTAVDALAAVKRMRFVSFDWGRMGKGHVDLGLSAQNLKTIDKSLVFEVEQQEGSPYVDLGSILNPNPTYLAAYLGRALQQALERIEALEAKVNKE